MLGTRVEVDGPGDGRHLGARLRAFTGVGPLGFTDTMEIVEWEPPRRCVVRHTGKVVRGDGVFEVVPLGPDRARFLWSELLDLPLGAVGALGWPGGRAGVPAGGRAFAARDGPAVRAWVSWSRCGWATSAPEYVAYHDDEWGRPLHGVTAMFERLSLEGFQSGLSWLVILRKRPAFRTAFAGFDPAAVARFDDADVARLLADAGIVRNRLKIEATVANARRGAGARHPARRAALVVRARPSTGDRPRWPTSRPSAPSPRRWRRS